MIKLYKTMTIALMIASMTQSNEIHVENMNDASIHCASLNDYDVSRECIVDAFKQYGYDDSMTLCENDEQNNCLFFGRVDYRELSFIDVNNVAYYLTLNDRIINV